jgi:hypothetical protein
MSGIKFPLGNLYATPAALEAIQSAGGDFMAYVVKHLSLDPGDLSPEDIRENELSLREGFRILSAYTLSDGKTKIWLITEADRSSTTVLLPEEY